MEIGNLDSTNSAESADTGKVSYKLLPESVAEILCTSTFPVWNFVLKRHTSSSSICMENTYLNAAGNDGFHV